MIDTSDPSNPLPPLFIGMGNCRISSTAKQCTISQLEPLVSVAVLVVVAQAAHRHSWVAPRSACSTVAAGWTCIACWGCPMATRSSTWATKCLRIYFGKEGTMLRMFVTYVTYIGACYVRFYMWCAIFDTLCRSKRTLGWRTCLIVPELAEELRIAQQ